MGTTNFITIDREKFHSRNTLDTPNNVFPLRKARLPLSSSVCSLRVPKALSNKLSHRCWH
jgi:hypothetical protein